VSDAAPIIRLPPGLAALCRAAGIVPVAHGEFLDPAATRARIAGLLDEDDRRRAWNGLVVAGQLDEIRPVRRHEGMTK
jgi:hypothetical protein